eukprot:m.365290 g.365290  ORF g.365290 m.365290 type:complete len:178 (-) comp30745_c0_seq1:146-679(-)
MPNYCNNTLCVTGSPEVIEKIRNAVEAGELCQKFRPLKEGESASNVWGTKWDVGSGEVLECTEREITCLFETAWTPPLGIYQVLFDNPEIQSLSGTYFEPGVQFAGKWENGVDVCFDDLVSYLQDTPVEERDALFEELDEAYDIVEFFEDQETQDEGDSDTDDNACRKEGAQDDVKE